jgi:hypothetical protein
MKRIIKFCLLGVIFASCHNQDLRLVENGETVIVGSDTFLVTVDTFRVLSVGRVAPRNIHEEMNPEFEHLTDRGKLFFLPYPKDKGDTIFTRTLKRIKK